jgi:hypothetical protein
MASSPPSYGGGFFTSDRAVKYGWGTPRLAAVAWLAFEVAPAWNHLEASPAAAATAATAAAATAAAATAAAAGTTLFPLRLKAYLASGRALPHLFVGAQGACVNVEVRAKPFRIHQCTNTEP